VVGQIRDPRIRGIEVGGINGAVVTLPRITRFISAALVVGLHVRIEASHDLDDGEALTHTIRRQRLKAIRPRQPFAQAHPPGVAQPEKRRAVSVFEMAMVG
jgi:hypothetical protein